MNITGCNNRFVPLFPKLTDFAVNIFSSGKNARENEKLKAEIASLNDQLRMVEGYKTENEKLRAMLQLAESRSDFESTAAYTSFTPERVRSIALALPMILSATLRFLK